MDKTAGMCYNAVERSGGAVLHTASVQNGDASPFCPQTCGFADWTAPRP